MGVYLSTPITDKESEDGEWGFLKYGASAMQGWRKGMEDAHLALGKLPGDAKEDETPISMFAVFDGHGGAEVARFCASHMPHEIQRLPEFQRGDYETALKKVFHRIDEILETGEHKEELTQYRALGEQAVAATNGGATDSTEDEDEDKAAGALSAQEALEIFQKLLAISNSNSPNAQAAGDTDAKEDEEDPEDLENNEENFPPLQAESNNTEPIGTNAENRPAIELPNAQPIEERPFPASINQTCRLPDHELQAGCTSVVCLLVDRTLLVANAGDSRAVISRAGKAIPLSIDHKPSQTVETNRIHRAGGFITQAGRVNGNLNLSRSIGDLKYKQNKELPPKDQIISAEPDVTRTDLHPDDEFLIIGCDGIWDCKTNQEAVDFVQQRLTQNIPISSICEELMDDCLAEDPRKTTGIGGDNMTCVIVQLMHNR